MDATTSIISRLILGTALAGGAILGALATSQTAAHADRPPAVEQGLHAAGLPDDDAPMRDCPQPGEEPASELAQPGLKPPGNTSLDLAAAAIGATLVQPDEDLLRALWPRTHLPLCRTNGIDPRPA